MKKRLARHDEFDGGSNREALGNGMSNFEFRMTNDRSLLCFPDNPMTIHHWVFGFTLSPRIFAENAVPFSSLNR